MYRLQSRLDDTVLITIKVAFTLLATGITLFILYRLRTVIGWLAVGAFLAIIINPAVSYLTRHMPGKRRGLGVTVVIVAGVLFFSALTSLLVPPLVGQATSLVQNWPETSEKIMRDIKTSNQAPYKFIRDHGLLTYAQQHKDDIRSGFRSFFSASLQSLVGHLSSIGAILTIAAMTVYLSASGPKYAEALKKPIPKKHQPDIEQLARNMYSAVTGYVNGNLLTSLIAGVTAGLVAALVGLPYAALLGFIVALTDLIPMVGATLGAIIVIIVALFTSLPAAIIMTAFFIIYQQIENYVIVPRVMGKTVQMSSFAVFVAALAGAVLAGFVGALVAIPIGACIILALKYIVRRLAARPQTKTT